MISVDSGINSQNSSYFANAAFYGYDSSDFADRMENYATVLSDPRDFADNVNANMPDIVLNIWQPSE